jgi:hypothetical protein
MEEHRVSRKRACDAFAGPSFQKPNATPFTHEPLDLSVASIRLVDFYRLFRTGLFDAGSNMSR